MKWAHSAPDIPQMNAEMVNASQRARMTLIPMASAACMLSREARSFIPSVDSLNRNATTMMMNAHEAAVHMSVYLSSPNSVRGPFVIAVHCDSTTCTITSSAKEAIAAAVSDSRRIGNATMKAKIEAAVARAQ